MSFQDEIRFTSCIKLLAEQERKIKQLEIELTQIKIDNVELERVIRSLRRKFKE